MMAQNEFITGLDIGTNSIKLLSVMRKANSDLLEVVAKGMIESDGVRKGVVVEPEKVTKKIQQLLSQIREINAAEDIQNVAVNINGKHLFTVSSRGLVSVSRADQTISEDDIERVIKAAQTVSLPSNYEIIESFEKDFIIDGQGGIRQPVGMKGVRLEVEVLNCCAFSPYLRNLSEAILDAGLGIEAIIPSPLAASEAVLTPRQKELGVVLIDIGAATTSMVVFEEGHLLHSAVFPVGSSHITNDIAIGLKVDVEVAERIKKEFGTCVRTKGGARKKKIKILQGEEFIFSQKTLSEIIEARVLEIFEMVNQELKKIDRQGKLPGGVVLTGGGAKLRKIEELGKKELKLATRIGIPRRILGIEEDPQVAALAGLAIEASLLERENEKSLFQENWLQKAIQKAKKIFKAFLP